MRRGRRVSEVWERAGMMWGVVWGRAREYGTWDVLAVGLGVSLGARVRLGAIKMCGDVSVCAHEVGHRAWADGAADAWIRWRWSVLSG